MSFGPSNLSFAALFSISLSLLMHRPKNMGEGGYPCLIALLLKKYFEKLLSIFNWHQLTLTVGTGISHCAYKAYVHTVPSLCWRIHPVSVLLSPRRMDPSEIY